MIDARTAHKIGDILETVEQETGMKLNARLRDSDRGGTTLCIAFLGRDVTIELGTSDQDFDARESGIAVANMLVSFVRQNVSSEVFLFISNVMGALQMTEEEMAGPLEEDTAPQDSRVDSDSSAA